MAAPGPLLSIAIPLYNRPREIRRALESCLAQPFDDFEVIVVDDASTDNSADVVAGYADCRLRLIRHERNRGMCPAYNTGALTARGQWVIFLDSDDELLPDALSLIAKHAAAAPDDIARLGFMYRYSTGGASPDPPLQDEVWGYTEYLQWMNKDLQRQDILHCTRRETFARMRMTDSRAYELSYLLDFAARYRTHTLPFVVGLVHETGSDRASITHPRRLLSEAPDFAADTDLILQQHGRALAEHAPRRYERLLNARAYLHFISGHRRLGLRYSLCYLRRYPTSFRGWGILAAGICYPRLICWLLEQATARRAHMSGFTE